MIEAATRSLAQLFDGRFLRVLGIATALTLLLYVLLAAGAGISIDALIGQLDSGRLPWLADNRGWLDGVLATLGGLGVFAGLVFLFPAVATMVMGAFLDDIVDAVEDRWYPEHRALQPPRLSQGLWLGLLSGMRLLLVNLLLLPVYAVLLVTGIGPFVLYLIVNGALLGRDFVQMVAIRHLGAQGEKAHRARTRSSQFAVGIVTSLVFLVPLANLLAPLLGAAMATHVFHAARPGPSHS